jgi:3-hydroxypropanoate dehydrogenase
MTKKILTDEDLNLLFRDARTYNNWQDKKVSKVVLTALFDLMKMAPTSVNCSPARFIFVETPDGKDKLKQCLDAGNVDKTMSAPLTAIVATDFKFYEQLPKLFPHTDARAWFVGNDEMINDTAVRNGTLQGAYLIMAARALGLDCGPMSGFDKEKCKELFFADQPDWQANFLINIGYGDEAGMHPRSPRFDFDDICKIV